MLSWPKCPTVSDKLPYSASQRKGQFPDVPTARKFVGLLNTSAFELSRRRDGRCPWASLGIVGHVRLGSQEVTVTHLRQSMLEELQRRNYSQSTVRPYIYVVEDFAKYFHRSPDRLRADHIHAYQVHLFRDRKLSPGTIEGRTAALRFLFVKTLRQPYLSDHIPFPKRQRGLATVLSQEEVARFIASDGNLMHRTMLMTLDATGLRRG